MDGTTSYFTLMFKETKGVGAGMDQAKKLVEKVVQITRVGLGKAS